MSEEKEDETGDTEEESEEVTMPKGKGKFWLIVFAGLVVLGIIGYLIFHHPAAAVAAKTSVKDMPTMVGGC